MDEIKNDPTYCRRGAEEFCSKAAAAKDAPVRAGLEAMARELEQRARCLSARRFISVTSRRGGVDTGPGSLGRALSRDRCYASLSRCAL
jgi:hypothetical protein